MRLPWRPFSSFERGLNVVAHLWRRETAEVIVCHAEISLHKHRSFDLRFTHFLSDHLLGGSQMPCHNGRPLERHISKEPQFLKNGQKNTEAWKPPWKWGGKGTLHLWTFGWDKSPGWQLCYNLGRPHVPEAPSSAAPWFLTHEIEVINLCCLDFR